MPMLNLLRPHRRSASAQSAPTQDSLHQQQQQQHHRPQQSHAQSTTTIHFLPPSQRQPSLSPSPSQAALDPHAAASPSTLPPLNFGSPGLLGSNSPNGFLNAAFGSSSNSLAPPATATAGNPANGGPVITTTSSSPRLGSPSLNKALPAPPSRTPPPQTLQPPQSLQLPSSPSSTHSRPGTGGSGKHALGHGGSSSSSTPQLPPLLTSFGKHKEKEANPHVTMPMSSSGHGKRNHAKLNILNPMTLLMRRRTAQNGTQGESSRKAGPRDLPADFDPGIIYATRHPDWSSPGPKRPPVDVINARNRDGRTLSPALAGMRVEGEEHVDRQRTPLFKECFGEDATTPKMQVGQQGSPPPAPKVASPAMARGIAPPPPPQLALQPPQEIRTPQIPQTPQTAILTSPAVSMGTTLVEKTPPVGQPLLSIDSPAMLAPARSNASSSSSASENDDDAYPQVRRKGVTLVDHPLSLPRHLMNNSSRFSFEASSAAGSSPGLDDDRDLGDAPQVPFDPNVAGLVLNKDGTPSVRQPPGGIGLGLGLGLGVGAPAAVGAGTDMDSKRQYPRRAPSRWRDDEGIEDVVDMASYENEDDDLYYDDGMILGDDDGEEQGFGNGDDAAYGMGSSRLGLAGLSLQTLPQSGQDGLSSGNDLAVETASLEPTIGGTRNSNGSSAFPPFMNPIGGGLGYQKQLEHFYTPDVMRMNAHGLPLALQTLDQSLCKVQQQRQQDDGLDSPAPGFGNEVDPSFIEQQQRILRAEAEDESMRMNFDDEDDEDDPMVAAANAEALAYDTEGEYGQEFGFYSATKADGSVSAEQLFAGGYFGDPGAGGPPRPFLVRRPSLTPISERSECSYRNSMVFGFETGPPGSRGGGGGGAHPLALSQSLAGLALNGDGTVQGQGHAQGQEGDMSLSQLLKLRRSWGGGSQAGSVKSPPGSPGGPTGVHGGGGGSPDMGSPVVGPGQGQLGMSPGGYGMGMYGANGGDWSEYAGGNGAGGVPLGLPPGMNLMGMGMMNGLHMGFGAGTIQQQINQMTHSAGSPVGPPQFYPVLKGGNTHNPGEGNPYSSLHGYQPGIGGQFQQQQQQQQQQGALDDDYGDDIDGFDGDIDGFDDDLDDDILDDYNYDNTSQQPQPLQLHHQDKTNPTAHTHNQPAKVVTGLARNTSAGQKSIAGDSSYASALGSPTTSEAARGDGRISMDEQIGVGSAGVR